MEIPLSQRSFQHVPLHARKTVGAAMRGEKPEIEGEKKPLSRQTVYGAVRRAVEIHSQMITEDGVELFDEDAADEPGRVKYRSLDFHFSGLPKNGELYANRGGSVDYTRITKDAMDTTYHSPQGRVEYQHFDLKSPENSYSIVQQQQTEVPPRELPTGASGPAPAVSNAVMPLGQALQGAGGELKAIFLDGEMSQAEYRLARTSQLQQQVGKLPDNLAGDLKKAIQAGRSSLPEELYHLSHTALAQADPQTQEQLRSIRATAGEWAAVESLPGASADGVTRRADYYVAPQTLNLMTAAQNWDFDPKSGLPIADSVVVGAGPGGLASSYHLSEKGQRTVIFEANSAGQAFSDKNAKSVHFLRTSEDSSNLIYTDDIRDLNHEASLRRQRFEIEAHTQKAQQDWSARTGETFHGRDEDTGISGGQAFPRAGLYDHMQRLAHGLSEKYPDTFLIERSPVRELQETEDGLFKVTTAKGHQVLARTLVLSTGFVGANGENARVLSQVAEAAKESPESTLFLQNDHDEMKNAKKMVVAQQALDQGRVEKVLMFSDRKLGSPDVRHQVASLPEGSRIALVGGGESGAKAALELLSLNPDVGVDFYTTDKLEPYQTQVPAGHLDASAVKKFHQHQEMADKSRELLKDFGSPITPDTLRGIFGAVKEGRIDLHTLGERFGPESVSTEVGHDKLGAALDISVTSESARSSEKRETEELKSLGLHHPSRSDSPHRRVRMLVSAVGYHTERSKPGPLVQQLVDQNLIDMGSGETDPRIVVNTAGLASDTADTAIVGRAIKGWETPHRLARFLPEREVPESKLDTQAPWFDRVIERRQDTHSNLSYEEVDESLEAGSTDIGILRFAERQVSELKPDQAGDIRLQFQVRRNQYANHSPMNSIDFMAENFPDALSPEEKLLHRRSEELLGRTTTVEEQIRAKFGTARESK